ncbi:Tn3 family transposase [Streptomyces sp. NRRL S-448]|uniref:Tn3 family transposase n=1 Tax=Streptomyces sp. NRRL S-448 TaxID=1463907 RepID=UPI003563AF44
MLRITGSVHTGAVRAYDVIRMLFRDGQPDRARRRHRVLRLDRQEPAILRLADEPPYQRQIKTHTNLQEGRHALARKIFQGRAGQHYQHPGGHGGHGGRGGPYWCARPGPQRLHAVQHPLHGCCGVHAADRGRALANRRSRDPADLLGTRPTPSLWPACRMGRRTDLAITGAVAMARFRPLGERLSIRGSRCR